MIRDRDPEREAAVRQARLYLLLTMMAQRASSVVLNYGEDTQQWEASWIVDGRRYVAVRRDPLAALDDAYHAVRSP